VLARAESQFQKSSNLDKIRSRGLACINKAESIPVPVRHDFGYRIMNPLGGLSKPKTIKPRI
jgi:hypothetical protein